MILMKHCSFYLQSLIQSIFCLPREFCDVTNVYESVTLSAGVAIITKRSNSSKRIAKRVSKAEQKGY